MRTKLQQFLRECKKKAVCGVLLRAGRERDSLNHQRPVRCDLEPGHFGDHRSRTTTATHTWWNPRG